MHFEYQVDWQRSLSVKICSVLGSRRSGTKPGNAEAGIQKCVLCERLADVFHKFFVINSLLLALKSHYLVTIDSTQNYCRSCWRLRKFR